MNSSITGRTKSMATDGSNVVVALYSEISKTMSLVTVQADSDSISGDTPRPCAGVPYVAYGRTNFLVVWLTGDSNSVDLHGRFVGHPEFPILSGLPPISLKGLSWDGQSFLVLWTADSNGVSSVYGQLLDPIGFPNGVPVLVSGPNAIAPECASAGAARHYLVWMESTGATNEWHTRSRSMTAEGQLSDAVTLSSAPAQSANPVAIAWGSGAAMAVWNRETGPHVYQDHVTNFYYLTTNYSLSLFGRRLEGDGSPAGSEFQITSIVGKQTRPQLAFDGTNFLAIWTDTRIYPQSTQSFGCHTYSQQLAPNGDLLNSDFRVADYSARPQALVYSGGQFISWVNWGYTSDSEQASLILLRPANLGVMGFRNFIPITDGHSQVEFTGNVSHGFYRLQASTNLKDWTWVPWDDFDPGWFVPLRPNQTTRWLDPFTNYNGPRFYKAVNFLDVCVSNLTLLQHVKEVWRAENLKRSSDLPLESDVIGPGKYLSVMPTCPAGGTYFLNDVATKPFCTYQINGHSL